MADRRAYFEVKAQIVGALAHPVRLQILESLAHGEASTGQLVSALGLPQPMVSQHLTVLRNHGVVQRRRVGAFQLYRLGDPRIGQACALMGDIVEGLVAAQRARLAPIAHRPAAAPPA